MVFGRAAVILGFLSVAMGLAALLRTGLTAVVIVAGGVGGEGLRLAFSILNIVALLAVTTVLLIGTAMLYRRKPTGRVLVVAGSLAAILLSAVEVSVWVRYDDLALWSDTPVNGPHRVAWCALAAVTLVLAVLPDTKKWCKTTASAEPAPPVGAAAVVASALALLPAGYYGWRVAGQHDFSFAYVAGTEWLRMTPSSLLPLVMSEAAVVSAIAAVTLLVGALLTFFRVRAGRWMVLMGSALSIAQAVFGWTDLAAMFQSFGATDLLTIFAPRTVPVVVLTLIVPVLVIVLALLPSSKAATPVAA